MTDEEKIEQAEKPTDYKQRQFLGAQFGFFLSTKFDPDDMSVEVCRLTNWFDWHISFFGWQVTAWIERVD